APAPGGRPAPGRPIMPYFGNAVPYVLTRLHTRYDKTTLSDDLIFREAQPVVGGRANWDGIAGDQGVKVEQSGVNNFQGRYIIRHYWEGKVSCKDPRYGVWGGPPSQGYGAGGGGQPKPAEDLANAPRGAVKLRDVVQSPLPALGLSGHQ